MSHLTKNEVIWSLTILNGKYHLETGPEQWCDFDTAQQAIDFYVATKQDEDVLYVHIDHSLEWNINPQWVRLGPEADSQIVFHPGAIRPI